MRSGSFIHTPETDPYHCLRQKKKSFLQELNEIWVNAWNLPPVIRQIVRATPLSENELLMELLLFAVYNPIFVRIPPRL